MRRNDLTFETRKYFERYNLPDWKVGFQTRKFRVMATTFFHPKTILFSTWYVDYNSPDTVRKTIIHEVAHAIVGIGVGHGEQWKRQARSMGLVNPSAITDSNTLIFPEPKWKGECECGLKHSRQRLTKKTMYCVKCYTIISWSRKILVKP